jgi:acetoin utilization deacetylase AcuC-like enzyme
LHVYSDDPVFERHVNRMAGVEAPERFPAARAGVEEAEGAGVSVEWCPCQPAPQDALEAVHTPGYLDRVEKLSAKGGGYLDLDTGLNEHSWEAATMASGAAIGAVESALSGTAAFSIARPPGHHAGRTYGMGFCLLNNVAIAVEHARSRGVGRIAILDWDVHHGNGTQDIFYADGEVLYLSVHQSPFYPGTGAAREVGEGEGQGFTVNVPLRARSGEDTYAAAFAGVFVPVLREFRPELTIVSAGYDAHADDLIGGMRLEAASFGRFAAKLAAVAREIEAAPPALMLEGGYNLRALTESVAATIEGVEQESPLDWEYSGDVGPIEEARKALAPFWESLR